MSDTPMWKTDEDYYTMIEQIMGTHVIVNSEVFRNRGIKDPPNKKDE